LAIGALRQRWDGARLWIVFEPRSNTTRRNIFQAELAEALSAADIAVVAGVPDPEKVPAPDRLDPTKLAADIGARGGEGHFFETVPEIVSHLVAETHPGDVVAFLSNGGFGGIHDLLLKELRK
jgi:UDP-N-acetylmuramate: L-alanyl-gamma-D-glutamyl-meso-diaminopimelate ligase